MSKNRERLERQLAHAVEALKAWERKLADKGITTAEDRERNAKWRQLRAERLELEARLRRVAKSESLVKELAQRKADKQAEPEEKPSKEKEKKPKGGKKAGGEGNVEYLVLARHAHKQ